MYLVFNWEMIGVVLKISKSPGFASNISAVMQFHCCSVATQYVQCEDDEYAYTLLILRVVSSETSAYFYQITRRHTLQDITLQLTNATPSTQTGLNLLCIKTFIPSKANSLNAELNTI